MKFFDINGQLSLFAPEAIIVSREEKVFQFTFLHPCSEREITYDIHRNK